MHLVIEYFDTPWCAPSRSRSARGGGWPSVRALQANNLWKYRTQARMSWIRNPCRARKIDSGVEIERLMDNGITWRPYCRLTLE